MNNIELSFCIPTYNRAQSIYTLVTDILRCDDPNIEVVVLDNGSTDESLSILQAIRDERLHVYSNGVNKGALYNALHVLNKGRGKYVVLSTDKDHIDTSAISEFKTFLLQHHELACGYCEYNSKVGVESELYLKGFQAVKKIGYIGHHPTGYFFNNEYLRMTDMTVRFSDCNFVGHFPFDFVFAELCLMGDGAIYHKPIFSPETLDMAAKQRSLGTNASLEDAFFSPQGRLKMAIKFSQHINTLPLLAQEKETLILDRFMQGLISATVGYRSIMKNNKLCIHYHMESRDISGKEMFTIGLDFYKKFLSDVRLLYGYNLLGQIRLKFYIFVRVFQKLIQKLFRLQK